MAKLTKAKRLVQEQMLTLLEWAAARPKSWHPIGTLPETVKAAELLAARGVIEIRKAENQYRLKPKTYQKPRRFALRWRAKLSLAT